MTERQKYNQKSVNQLWCNKGGHLSRSEFNRVAKKLKPRDGLSQWVARRYMPRPHADGKHHR